MIFLIISNVNLDYFLLLDVILTIFNPIPKKGSMVIKFNGNIFPQTAAIACSAIVEY
jgi:hypothetical protein